jgi:hypothetical protein
VERNKCVHANYKIAKSKYCGIIEFNNIRKNKKQNVCQTEIVNVLSARNKCNHYTGEFSNNKAKI